MAHRVARRREALVGAVATLLVTALPARLAAAEEPPRGPALPASRPTGRLASSLDIEDEVRALDTFYAKLAARQVGKTTRVRISHFGDSHITNDILTDEVRRLLQAEFGDGGPGFVLLGKPWRTYTHAAVKTGAGPGWRAERLWASYGKGRPRPRDDLFGLAGISTHALGAASAWVERRAGAPLEGLEIYFLRQPGGGRLEIVVAGRRLQWIFSVASDKEPGYVRLALPPAAGRIELEASLGEVRLFGADLQSGAAGVIYDTLGINGARASTVLGWNEALMADQLTHLSPDLVILAYGTNEVDSDRLTRPAFAAQFEGLLQKMHRLLPKASCLVLGPPDRARYRRRTGWEIPDTLDFIVEEERRLARAHGCGFWDQRAVMGGSGSVRRFLNADPPLALSDRVHLSAAGYRALGQALHQALLRGLARFRETRRSGGERRWNGLGLPSLSPCLPASL